MKSKWRPKMTREAREFEREYERGEWKPIPRDEFIWLRQQLKEAARETIEHRKKQSRISIRVNNADLDSIRVMAADQGIPYQTLIGSVLHRFNTGQLIDRDTLDDLALIRESKKRAS